MLLYPGDPIDSKFISYRNQEIDQRDHQCKVGFVSVLNQEKRLRREIGTETLALLGLSARS